MRGNAARVRAHLSGGRHDDRMPGAGALPAREIRFHKGTTAAARFNPKHHKRAPMKHESMSKASAKPGKDFKLMSMQDRLFPTSLLKRCMTWSRGSHVAPGLYNLGNTCFLNATLQCLTHLPPLGQLCMSTYLDRYGTTDTHPIMHIFRQHIQRALRSSGGQPVAPKRIVGRMRHISPTIRIGRQEDAHEFTRQLLEAVHQGELKARGIVEKDRPDLAATSFIYSIFGGYSRL
jgi:hypothetical protein